MKVLYYCPGCRHRVLRNVIRRNRYLTSFCSQRGKKYRMKIMARSAMEPNIVSAWASREHSECNHYAQINADTMICDSCGVYCGPGEPAVSSL